MKYVSLKLNLNSESKPAFDNFHINSSRRDLLKQLMVMGALGTTSLISSSFSYAATDKPGKALSLENATWRKEEKYEDLRNAMTWKPNIPARYPDVIVHASSEQEIIQALEFARINDLQVVTRSSGHNIDTLRNGGMLLNISSMTELSIDASSMQASVQPAVISYYFYEQIANLGLIFPVPECHTVALGGYLLGGGYASMGYYWGDGPACYSIIAADVILADGSKVRASKEENPDLYWAIRGVGPGFFGVVTRYQLQLYQQPEVFMQSTYEYPIESISTIISRLQELVEEKSKQTQINIVLEKAPGVSSPLNVKFKIRALGKDDAEVSSLLSTYSEIESASVISKNENQRIKYSDFMYNPGRSERNLSDNIWTEDRRAITSAISHCKNIPEDSAFIMTLYSDRNLYPARDDACHSAEGMHFMSNHLLWNDADKDVENEQWYAGLCANLWPYASSYYVSQMEGTDQAQRMQKCFSVENWQRLSELRHSYDPDKRFFAHMT